MVHLNYEELEEHFQHFKEEALHRRNEAIQLKEEVMSRITEHTNELLNEVQFYVNSRVNKFSQIQVLVPHLQPFEKTLALFSTQNLRKF